MTEAEWLVCIDPQPMVWFLTRAYTPKILGIWDIGIRIEQWLGFPRYKTSARKLRLFACACCRRVWDRFPDDCRQRIVIGERYADDEIPFRDVERAAAPWGTGAGYDSETGGGPEVDASMLPVYSDPTYSALWANEAAWLAKDHGAERRVQSEVLRDIVGNPFRRVRIDHCWIVWNSGTLRELAQAIYTDLAFDRLPILADALEDAGCTNADILAHCRGPGPHVRGCWVIDLLLGKS
jgi:hypothetical protein